jgi:hypothetical protein
VGLRRKARGAWRVWGYYSAPKGLGKGSGGGKESLPGKRGHGGSGKGGIKWPFDHTPRTLDPHFHPPALLSRSPYPTFFPPPYPPFSAL